MPSQYTLHNKFLLQARVRPVNLFQLNYIIPFLLIQSGFESAQLLVRSKEYCVLIGDLGDLNGLSI